MGQQTVVRTPNEGRMGRNNRWCRKDGQDADIDTVKNEMGGERRGLSLPIEARSLTS